MQQRSIASFFAAQQSKPIETRKRKDRDLPTDPQGGEARKQEGQKRKRLRKAVENNEENEAIENPLEEQPLVESNPEIKQNESKEQLTRGKEKAQSSEAEEGGEKEVAGDQEEEDEAYEDEDDDDDEAMNSEEEREEKENREPLQSRAASVKKVLSNKKGGKDLMVTNLLKHKYDPIQAASWKPGDKVPYLFLARTFAEISQHSARTKILGLLTNMFRSIIALSPNDLLPAIYLTINKIAPNYQGLELGIGDALLKKAIAASTGRKVAAINAEYEKLGDLGLVAQSFRNTQRTMFPPPKLTIPGVFATLKKIAESQGRESMKKKEEMIQTMLVSCQECESQFIIRSLQGKLRIRMAEKTVQTALAYAIILTPPSGRPQSLTRGDLEDKLVDAAQTLRAVLCELPNYDIVVPVLLSHPEVAEWRVQCHLTPGIPVHPMLAQPTKGIAEVLNRFADMTFTCEWKYDGERAQIHFMEDGTLKVYSRNLEDNTAKYPDIALNLPLATLADTKSFILDCEVVAFDREQSKILPFQILSTRARKAVQLSDVTVQVCLFAFDLLYLNGKSLLQLPFKARRELLHNSFQEVHGKYQFAQYCDTNNTEDIAAFLNEAIAGNCEGLMIKTLETDATYEPSRRSYNWLKVKKDYLNGVTDSLDLVPIAAFYGKGKRNGVLGSFLLACYDPENEEYQTVCKIGTGFSDSKLEELTTFFKEKIISQPRPYYNYDSSSTVNVPDVWFDSCVVWEVKAADLSLSPLYKAAVGLVTAGKGISLRFPRFIRDREDKNPEDATCAEQIAEMYQNQGNAGANNK